MSYGSNILETIPETEDARSKSARELRSASAHQLGLVVLWNSDEPNTIGAFLPVTEGTEVTQVLGRGPMRRDDDGERLVAILQRPSGNEALPPFESPSLSRVQLIVNALCNHRLEITNVGRRRLCVNGSVVEQSAVELGDVIELGPQLVLLCTYRPRHFEVSVPLAIHPFGEPDANGFVGESWAAWKLRSELAFVSPRRGHVLIVGNTGTGKELVSNAVHSGSRRAGPLVSRNAATIPESLVDAELFGNMRGYPNPGMPERKGLFGAAHGGSLFLDEFADLPLSAQAHILRVLDAGQYHRLGEENPRWSDFRLIAATNRPEAMLRTDIVARFEFRLRTPNLSERPEDIPLLAKHLLHAMCAEAPELRQRFYSGNGLPRFDAGFIRKLVRHDYQGNVRELRRLLWSAISNSAGDCLKWPEAGRPMAAQEPLPTQPDGDMARDVLQQALDANNGSIEKTWRALGLSSRHVLQRLLRKHNLSVTRQHGHA